MVLIIGLQPTKTRAELVVRLVDGLIFETNILWVSPVKVLVVTQSAIASQAEGSGSKLPSCDLSYVADPPRGFASYLEKVMKRQWGSRRDTSCDLVIGTA